MTVISAVNAIPLLDLKLQHGQIREEILAAITRVIDSQSFILGDEVKSLESEIACYCSAKHAIACASGSDAVLLALMALGIGPGDKVLTSPYTFLASVSAICRVGATPVFADIEEDTFNLDPTKAELALAKHPETRAMIPIHLFGGSADMGPLLAMATKRGVSVVEDAAQAIGSEYQLLRAGTLGAVGCFSFFPSKNLGAFGDGGMLTTNDSVIADKLRILRVHGARKKYHHDVIGINSRLDALQAAVLRVKLQQLDSWTGLRQRNAQLYRNRLIELRVPITLPIERPYQTRHVYNQFVIVAQRRDQLKAFLKEQGIGTEIYYPLPMHLQTCFAHLGYARGEFPVSERLAERSLALPIYPELDPGDIEYICQKIGSFYL